MKSEKECLKLIQALFGIIIFHSVVVSWCHAAVAGPPHGRGIVTTTVCEHYNDTACGEAPECFKQEQCSFTDPDKRNHCFVLWQVDSTGKMTLKLKGCFLESADCYNKSECVENAQNPKKDLLFCCCDGDMCNQNFVWSPKPTQPPKIAANDATPIEQEGQQIMVIVLYTVIALLLIIISALIMYSLCCQRKFQMFIELPTVEAQSPSPPSPKLGNRNIELLEIKAHGRFGAVWKALYKNDEVAVKVFPVQDKQSWISEQEIYKLPHMQHPDILRYIGVEKRFENLHAEFWLITSYHEKGSLCDYLKGHTLTWAQLCRIAETMARGLMHLHEEIPASKAEGYKPAIAHRDFKSKNVLLKSDMSACIADFGLALIFHPGQPCGDTHGQVGTRRYMAPEVLEGAINFTRDSFLRIDMYACGLVLWELASRCSAVCAQPGEYRLPLEEEVGQHPTLEDMQEAVVQRKVRPTIKESWKTHPGLVMLCDTMEECWDHDAEARLSASCVIERVALQSRFPATSHSTTRIDTGPMQPLPPAVIPTAPPQFKEVPSV